MSVGTQDARRGPLMWQVLTNRHRYGVLFIGAAMSNFGNWCQTLAGILLIYRLTDSVLLVGIGAVAQFIWPIVFGPWAGAVSDRFDRLHVLTVTQVIAAVVSGALAILTFTGVVTVVIAMIAIACLGILQAFQAPAQLSLVPLLVDDDQLEVGLALNSSQFNLARAVGPMLATALIALGGLGLPFAVNAVSFLAFALMLRFVRPKPQLKPATPPRVRDTFAAVMSAREVLPIFALGFVISGSVDTVNTLGPAMSVELIGTDALTSWFITAFGAGALLSAFYLVGLLRNLRRRLPLAIGVQALGAILFAAGGSPWIALTGCVLFGVGFILSANRALSVVQRMIAPDLVGRVTAVWLMAFLGGRAVYALGTGAIAEVADAHTAAGITAATIVVAAIGALFLAPRKRNIRS